MTLVRMLVRQAGQYEVGTVRNVTEAEAQDLIARDEATLAVQHPGAIVEAMTPPTRRTARRGGAVAETASVAPPVEERG